MMAAFFAALLGLQDPPLPRRPESGKYESLTPRPYRRHEGFCVAQARRCGGSQETDDALLSALDWLARNQAADGSWDAPDEEARIEVAGLALLAFVGAGYTTWAQEDCRIFQAWRSARTSENLLRQTPPVHLAIRRATGFLLRNQGPDGFIGRRGAVRSLRGHAIAAGALSELYGWSSLLILREPAEKAIQALVAEPFSDNDEATIDWAALALRSAALSSLAFPRIVDPSLNPKKRDASSIRAFMEHPPAWERRSADSERWYWGTMALFFYDGAEGPIWKRWNDSLKDTLLRHQQSARDEHPGSWDPLKPGGRAAATGLYALTLAIYYQPRIYAGR